MPPICKRPATLLPRRQTQHDRLMSGPLRNLSPQGGSGAPVGLPARCSEHPGADARADYFLTTVPVSLTSEAIRLKKTLSRTACSLSEHPGLRLRGSHHQQGLVPCRSSFVHERSIEGFAENAPSSFNENTGYLSRSQFAQSGAQADPLQDEGSIPSSSVKILAVSGVVRI